MVTVAQVISDLLNPLLGLVGVLLRGVGALGAGVVAGTVVRHGIDYKMQARFFVPLVFLGTVILFWVAASGTWSGPGAVGMLGIGLFVGYRFMRSPTAETAHEQEDQD